MSYFIDLDFRPVTYFRPQPLEAYALSQVKGALLQAHLREQLASDQHDEVAHRLCVEGVSEGEVQALINEHPWFMGGNYLANQEHAEVEIARIFIQSVTGDVTAVYAKPAMGRIRYRVVDEYEGETLDPTKATRESKEPLTLDELYEFFTTAWPFHQVLEMNFDGYAGKLDAMLKFFQAESDFYPDLDALCRCRVLEAFPPEDEEEDTESQ